MYMYVHVVQMKEYQQTFFTSVVQIDVMQDKLYMSSHKNTINPADRKNEHITVTPSLSGFCNIRITCVQHGRDREGPCELQQSADMPANNNLRR